MHGKVVLFVCVVLVAVEFFSVLQLKLRIIRSHGQPCVLFEDYVNLLYILIVDNRFFFYFSLMNTCGRL